MNYVCALIFTLNKEYVWLIKKNRPDWQKGKLNGIGGKIEKGETPAQAMSREFKEEAGIDIEPYIWEPTVTLIGQDFHVYFFTAKTDAELMTMEDEMIASYHLSDLNNLPILPSLKWLIPLSLDEEITKPIVMHTT